LSNPPRFFNGQDRREKVTQQKVR